MSTEEKTIDLNEILKDIEKTKQTLVDLQLIVESVIEQKKEVVFKLSWGS